MKIFFNTKALVLGCIALAVIVGVIIIARPSSRLGAQVLSLVNGGANVMVTPVCKKNTPPWIRVVSPNGGETYVAGQYITVRWKSCNIPGNAPISLNLDHAAKNAPETNYAGAGLGNSTPNDGEEYVRLPLVNMLIFSPNANGIPFGKWFRVSASYFTGNIANPSAGGATISDKSDALFTVTQSQTNSQ